MKPIATLSLFAILTFAPVAALAGDGLCVWDALPEDVQAQLRTAAACEGDLCPMLPEPTRRDLSLAAMECGGGKDPGRITAGARAAVAYAEEQLEAEALARDHGVSQEKLDAAWALLTPEERLLLSKRSVELTRDQKARASAARARMVKSVGFARHRFSGAKSQAAYLAVLDYFITREVRTNFEAQF